MYSSLFPYQVATLPTVLVLTTPPHPFSRMGVGEGDETLEQLNIPAHFLQRSFVF